MINRTYSGLSLRVRNRFAGNCNEVAICGQNGNRNIPLDPPSKGDFRQCSRDESPPLKGEQGGSYPGKSGRAKKARFASTTYLLLGAALVAGCAGTQERLQRAGSAHSTVRTEDILSDLASNDEAIRNFRAAATFTLESPDLKAVQKFRSARIRFRRPSDLFVSGHHRVTNLPVFKLWSVGHQFLLEFPLKKRDNYYSFEGARVESVPFPVSPSEIVREMFLPEDWSALPNREVHLVERESDGEAIRIEIGPRSRPRRLLSVTLYGTEDPAWVIVRNERVNDLGQTIAVTTMGEYILLDGIRFPTRLKTVFPIEETRMLLELRKPRVNADIDDSIFDIESRARELGLL